jgi:hypothetical protein
MVDFAEPVRQELAERRKYPHDLYIDGVLIGKCGEPITLDNGKCCIPAEPRETEKQG